MCQNVYPSTRTRRQSQADKCVLGRLSFDSTDVDAIKETWLISERRENGEVAGALRMKMRMKIEVLDEEDSKRKRMKIGRNLKFSINLFLKPQTCGVIDIVWVEAKREKV